MSKKTLDNVVKNIPVVLELDPLECPFREYRDNELHIDTWGMGPNAFRAHIISAKTGPKAPHEQILWVDEQTQPLPRSVRHYLHGWVRAEELAMDRWEAEVVIFEDEHGGKMNVADMQLSHTQVLMRSSFSRRVLSACFILERVDSLIVEHQWDNFICSFAPEGWRAKYHIYSPGIRPGGGSTHKPILSKNGCYLVRLYFLGAWRCVWVSDQVPVDATGSPLLPFSPLLTHPPAKPGSKSVPPAVTSDVVYLWPLLLCKAMLKLAAPDMNSDEETECVEDEKMTDFDILHALTGAMNLRYQVPDADVLWNQIVSEVQLFSWDDDDETLASTVKSRSTKKPTAKEPATIRRSSLAYLTIRDSRDLPPYHLPGITPGHEMSLLITMARDLPLKKPLPEPEVALWKYYRWVDWARSHGLYQDYDCPRTKYLKVNGLLKLSHAPHLLDVQSTESITYGFIEEHVKSGHVPDDYSKKKDKKSKDQAKSATNAAYGTLQQMKEELREWIQFETMKELVSNLFVMYYPSLFQYTSAGNNPPIRITKILTNKSIDITAPKAAPLYLQIDGPEGNKLRLSLSMLNPRILLNSGVPVLDYIEPAYLVLEKFEWFKDTLVPVPKAYVRTRGYESVEVNFEPGRHFCRVWIHSRMGWHISVLSESTILLGTRDVIQGAAVRECPWASKYLLTLGTAFGNWMKVNRSNPNILTADREFYRSYLPDLPWDKDVVGYNRSMLHWMFRQALQSHLLKRLYPLEYRATCNVLRKYFCDPDFGFPEKPKPPRSVREIANMDVCDCLMPETEEVELLEELIEEEQQPVEVKPLVEPDIMAKLLGAPKPPIASQVCELATEELPCAVLKDEREKMIRKHEAAIVLQAHWRGTWTRNCLKSHIMFTPEVTRHIQESTFGNLEALSSLLNEFFGMFPGAKYAYSVASALSGVYGLHQHIGSSPISPKCKWVPYFQGVFYCHYPVKVHFDVQSSLAHNTFAVYCNETGNKLPQAYNTHNTFDFQPNLLGYTVSGHGTLNQSSEINMEAQWQLTVMTSIDGVFHICDNEDPCRELPLPHSSKLHIDEIFLPNRRNILGGVQISVTRQESVAFRAAATSPDLEMVATLRAFTSDGSIVEVSKCSGKGEIFWPYICLEANSPPYKSRSISQATVNVLQSRRDLTSARSLMNKHLKPSKASPSSKNRSVTKVKPILEPKLYSIEVVCPLGWPLTLSQWKRVDEVRNSQEYTRLDMPAKKIVKETKPQKPGSAKEKEKDKLPVPFQIHMPQPGDAFVELECALAFGGGAQVKRDDDRDLEFATARKSWDSRDPGRNQRGAQLRKEFRNECLEAPPLQPLENSVSSTHYNTYYEEMEGEEFKKESKEHSQPIQLPGPSPVTESGLLELTVESEEEALYLTMPEQLRDKFIPLHFLPLCMKEKDQDESVFLTSEMTEAAKKSRHARIEAAMERMRDLQVYNEECVLGRQRYRCQLLEKLFVDAQWCPQLQDVLELRDEAITKETLNRALSATKKKLDAKKK